MVKSSGVLLLKLFLNMGWNSTDYMEITFLSLVSFGAKKHLEGMRFVTMASLEKVAIPGECLLVGFMVLNMI